MKIDFNNINFKIDKERVINTTKELTTKTYETVKKLPKKAKLGAVVALFLLPTIGVVNKCSTSSKNPDEIVIVDEPVDLKSRDKFVNKTLPTFHVVQKGENPSSIANKYNVSLRRLQKANSLNSKSIIHANDTLLIPESYEVKNVEKLSDVEKLTGLSEEYLEKLIDFEKVLYKAEPDRNGNMTIGVGHWIQPYEQSKYEGRISDEDVYSLLGKDLLNCDLDLRTGIDEKIYDEMPAKLKESIIDLAFNKGVGAVLNNEKLVNALNSKDYVTAIANLNQDYSVVKNKKGEVVHKPASGLSKRRLYEIANASEIFKNGYPSKVLNAANKVYSNGLKYMEQERDRGEIPANAYENVKKEYISLVNEWFNGKVGSVENNLKDIHISNVTPVKNGQTIAVNGEKTNWTVETLYQDWEKTAKRNLRAVKRPLPEVDANGNIVASVKVLEPNGDGAFSGKTILINPGHGGAVNNIQKGGKINVNFDPGTSNAKMSKKNPNLETNEFIGNGGKSLEEWVVNMRIADDLAEKIRKEGGTVIYVQGSVYSAQKAIRSIQKKQKLNMIVSLHSNSDGAKRGILVIANKRGGVDKKDKALAEVITKQLNKHSWFKGITQQKEQSLGVLSTSSITSSSVPGVLIETGNLKNEKDVANLNSRNFKKELINSIFEGMKQYLK